MNRARGDGEENSDIGENLIDDEDLILCDTPKSTCLPVIGSVVSTMPRPQVLRPYNPDQMTGRIATPRMGPPYPGMPLVPLFPNLPTPTRPRMIHTGPVIYNQRFLPPGSIIGRPRLINKGNVISTNKDNVISIEDSSSSSSVSSNHSSDEDETDTAHSKDELETDNDSQLLSTGNNNNVVPSIKSEGKNDARATMRAGPSRERQVITIPSDDNDSDDDNSCEWQPAKTKKAKLSAHFKKAKQNMGISTGTQNVLNLLGKSEEDEDMSGLVECGLSMVDQEKLIDALVKSQSCEKPRRVNTKGLYSHVKHGNIIKVLLFLNAGSNPVSINKSEEGKTPIHAAAAKGHIEILILLLYKGGLNKIDSKDNKCRTPLFLAVEKKHLKAAQFLVKGGADVFAKNGDGMTLLHVAVRKGQMEMVQWLINMGLSINEQDKYGYTALMWASESDGNHEVIRFLIKKGANTSITDKEMNVCLHWSSIAGSFECTRELIVGTSNPQVNTRNKFGETALHVAAKGDHYHVTQLLLLHGGDITIKNNLNATPLEVCPAGSKTFHCIRIRNEVGERRDLPFAVINDISKGKEKIPVRCVNEVDNEPFPNDFVYISRPEASSQVSVNHGLSTVRPCKCESECSIDCKCVRLSENQKLWYTEDGRVDLSLFDEESPVLFECTPLCSCSIHCPNRLVQKGIQFPLEVFKTRTKGWGLRTAVAVPQGSFILAYVGEIITDAEAEKRNADTYLFNLDLKTSGDEPNCMDALKYGNCGRFINHSCDANMKAVKLFTSHRDVSFPEVAFFACRDIEAKEELCFDYGDSFWDVKNESGVFCKCHTTNCQYSKSK